MGTKLLANICFQTEQRQDQRARPLHTLFDDFMVQLLLLSNEAFLLKYWKFVKIVLYR
jgi:hypothetical protein